jgi:hypothetical protein
VATRVLTRGCLRGAKAGVRREACLEARNIVLCSIVMCGVERKMVIAEAKGMGEISVDGACDVMR